MWGEYPLILGGISGCDLIGADMYIHGKFLQSETIVAETVTDVDLP